MERQLNIWLYTCFIRRTAILILFSNNVFKESDAYKYYDVLKVSKTKVRYQSEALLLLLLAILRIIDPYISKEVIYLNEWNGNY